MTVPDYVRLARHEWDLDDDGHEDILSSVTTETDTSLRLAPDGVGGVEFAAGSGATALDDLTDVVITSAATGDRLRFNGTSWVNTTLTWEPMVDGTGLVMLDGLGNIMRHEVAY